MLTDLRRLAAEDGLAASTVLAASATTGAGIPELRDLLAEAAKRRLAATQRLTADVRAAAHDLLTACGRPPGTRGESAARSALVHAWGSAAGLDEVAEAVRRSTRRSARTVTGWPLTRWFVHLRPDPLRRLGLGRPRSEQDLVRSSRPAPAAGARAAAVSTLRGYVDAATSGAPDAWVLAARARAGAVDLDDVLDRTVVRVPVGSPRVPWTWRMLTFAQWVLLAVSGAGLVWLLLLAGMGLLQLRSPRRRCGGAYRSRRSCCWRVCWEGSSSRVWDA